MTLLLDLGNSALKWAVLEEHGLGARGRLMLHDDDGPAALEQAWGALEPPERVLLASVAEADAAQPIMAWCATRWQTETEVIRPLGEAYGVTNAYREPERLGVDRWLALIAARARATQAAFVVDCGSAVTLDVLDQRGVHLGGLIVPGLTMMTESLTRCAQIKLDAEPDWEAPLLARDTTNAVRGGTLYAAVALIDRVLSDVSTELAQPMQHLITGGDAQRMLPLLRHPFEHRPDLVLEGLAVVARATECA